MNYYNELCGIYARENHAISQPAIEKAHARKRMGLLWGVVIFAR